MKLSKLLLATVLVPLLCVEEVKCQDMSGMSRAMMFLALIGGYLLGHLAFSGFMLLLMAVVPSDEARSLNLHHRAARSVFEPSPMTQAIQRTNFIRNIEMPPIPSRTPKFLTSLLRSDPLNCMPQVMCELVKAKEPGPTTDALNDYKFLINEFLKTDDDDKDGGKESAIFRTDSRKFKRKVKKKPAKKNDDSSLEDSVSKPSEEEKADGMAEFMELRDDDLMEDKVLNDMVDEDPDDFIFALADVKKKEKLKGMVKRGEFGSVDPLEENFYPYGNGYINGLRFQRNVELLERTLKENEIYGVFRNSRALRENFIARKQLELNQTKDISDRVRIAAEVAGVTRSSRKCRALFDTCPMNGSGIENIVKKLRRAVTGNQGKKTSTSTISEIKELIRDMQPKETGSGTDVRVILNIGGGPSGMGTGPVTEMTTQQTPPISTTIYSLPKVSTSPSTTQTTTTTFNPPTNPTKSVKFPIVSKKSEPDYAKITQLLKIKNPPPSTPQKFSPIKDQYKVKLQEASKLLNQIPRSLSKSFSATKYTQPISNISQVHERLTDLINVIEPKINKDSDSESEESSEELLNHSNLKPTPQTMQEARTSIEQQPKPQARFQRILTPTGFNNINEPSFQHQQYEAQNHNQGSSWMRGIYDMLFKDRQTHPLPQDPQAWVPSAQRHGKHSGAPFGHNEGVHGTGRPPRPFPMPMRMNPSRPQPHNPHMYPPPYPNFHNQPQPPHYSDFRNRDPVKEMKPKSKSRTFRNENIGSNSGKSKKPSRGTRRGPIKYKSCCSKSKSSIKYRKV